MVRGKPFVGNYGSISIGDKFTLSSMPAMSHLVATAGGSLVIGDRVVISYGAAISAMCQVTIADGTNIGPYVVIMDSDFHGIDDRNGPGKMAPVSIGRNVSIGARVTILRGAQIGDGAKVRSGSVVTGRVESGTTVGGVPARVIDVAKDAAIIP